MNNAIKNTGRNQRKRLGQTLVEFTFVGIPIIFILISIFEVSRGMWIYHTLAYAAKVGARYASVHGINCIGNTVNTSLQNPNNCAVNLGPASAPSAGAAPSIAYMIRQAAVGLDPDKDHRGLQRRRDYHYLQPRCGRRECVSGDHMAALRFRRYLHRRLRRPAAKNRYHDALRQRHRPAVARR